MPSSSLERFQLVEIMSVTLRAIAEVPDPCARGGIPHVALLCFAFDRILRSARRFFTPRSLLIGPGLHFGMPTTPGFSCGPPARLGSDASWVFFLAVHERAKVAKAE
jgi:hypothetical protein